MSEKTFISLPQTASQIQSGFETERIYLGIIEQFARRAVWHLAIENYFAREPDNSSDQIREVEN